MAASFGQGTITHAAPYWLEQLPYTVAITNLAAGASETVFAVRNWNPPANPAGIYVELTAVGASPVPGAQLVVRYDQNQARYDLATWPTNLTPVPIGAGAFKQLSLEVTNPSRTAIPQCYLTYTMTVWRDPVAVKLLRGGQLTAQDQQVLRMLGVSAQQFAARGHTPLNIDGIIRTSVDNRQVDVSRPYALLTTIQAGQQTTIPAYLAQPNQMLVLRSIAVGANPEDAVQVTVDRDNDAGHVLVNAWPGDMDHPLRCFVPALQTLTVHLSATNAPAYPVPVQLEIQRIALSELWTTRLGLLSLAQLQQQLGAAAGQQVYSRVEAGVL